MLERVEFKICEVVRNGNKIAVERTDIPDGFGKADSSLDGAEIDWIVACGIDGLNSVPFCEH